MIDAVDLAVHSDRRVEFSAPRLAGQDAEEYRRHKRVRIELEYDADKIAMRLYHLGADDQADWYAASNVAAGFGPVFRPRREPEKDR
ncbi:MAG: hypothetical protein V3V67_03100 [Myxococcota bacterium]